MFENLWLSFLTAVALVLVIEGILPFLSPDLWRSTLMRMLRQSDKQLRIMGLASMLLGVVILFVLHHFF